MHYNGDYYLTLLEEKHQPKLAYNENVDFEKWRLTVADKLKEVLGIDVIEENACPMNVRIIEEKQKDGYKQIHFAFETEIGAFVPCWLLIPDTGKGKYPLAIVLQGHNKEGAISSVGEWYDEQNEENIAYVKDRGDFAVQAVKNGFAGLAIEQRGMGLRNPENKAHGGGCSYENQVPLLLGRTVIGGRAWDISRAIDAMATFPQVDTEKIIVTGNSGGGTATFYAACLDERIKLAVPSCAFCTFGKSIVYRQHCACNYIPSIYRWFDMQDLSCLIVPRDLIIVSGEKDDIFLLEGVKKGYQTVEKIFAKAGAANKCQLLVTPKGHFWCKDLVWNTIKVKIKELGW